MDVVCCGSVVGAANDKERPDAVAENRTRKRWYTASQCVCVSTSRGDSIKAVEGVDERETDED